VKTGSPGAAVRDVVVWNRSDWQWRLDGAIVDLLDQAGAILSSCTIWYSLNIETLYFALCKRRL
jgi:hypothetical protein